MASATLDFYYDFASPFSYLSAMRLASMAEAARVLVRWCPVVLEAQDHPAPAGGALDQLPASGPYPWDKVERLAGLAGLPRLLRPDPFPADSRLAAAVAIYLNDASRPSLTRSLFLAAFAAGRDISRRESVEQVLAGLGHFCADVVTEADVPEVYERLRAQSVDARARGVVGTPSFITADGRVFGGNDQLELALAHASALAKAA